VPTTELRIEGMSCGHCVEAVTRALQSLEGVSRVRVTLEGKRAAVEHAQSAPPLARMIEVVKEEGYTATGA
jgi:copper chaperone